MQPKHQPWWHRNYISPHLLDVRQCLNVWVSLPADALQEQQMCAFWQQSFRLSCTGRQVQC